MLESGLNILIIIASLAVLCVLVVGLYALLKRKGDVKLQNKMMQARIFFQLVALIILAAIFYLKKTHS